MGERDLIGFFCDPMLEADIAGQMEREVPGADIWFSEQESVLEAASEAAEYSARALVVVDGARGASDEDVVAAARALSGTGTKMVFSSSSFARTWPSRLGAALVDAGCTNLAVAMGAEPREWLRVLAERIADPMGPDDAEALCLRRRAEAEGGSSDRQAAGRQDIPRRKAKSSFPSAAEPSEFAMSKHVGVCQCVTREGSTHLAIAMSRVLTLSGKRVACVVPKKHIVNLRKMFSRASYDADLERIEVSGITFFEGNLPSAVPTSASPEDDYDVVVTDFDCIDWYGTSQTPAQMEHMERRRQAFNHSDVRILSCFLDPAGAWNASNKYFAAIPKGDLKKTTLAVYGLSDPALEKHYRKELAAAGLDPRKLVPVEAMPLPIVARDLSAACPGVVRLAGEALPARDRAALIAQVEADEEEAARAAKVECLRLLEKAGLSTDTARLADVRTYGQAAALVDKVALEAAMARGADVSELRDESVRALVAQLAGEPADGWDAPEYARMLAVAKALDARGTWDPLAVEAARGMTDAEARAAAERIAAGESWNSEEEPERKRGIWPFGRGTR